MADGTTKAMSCPRMGVCVKRTYIPIIHTFLCGLRFPRLGGMPILALFHFELSLQYNAE